MLNIVFGNAQTLIALPFLSRTFFVYSWLLFWYIDGTINCPRHGQIAVGKEALRYKSQMVVWRKNGETLGKHLWDVLLSK